MRSSNKHLLFKALMFPLIFIIPGAILLESDVSHLQSVGIEMIGAGISFLLVFSFWDLYQNQKHENTEKIVRLENILLNLDTKTDKSLEVINNLTEDFHNTLSNSSNKSNILNYLKFLSIGFIFGTILIKNRLINKSDTNLKNDL